MIHALNCFVFQVIILARESGLKLELADIPVENLVPEPLRVRLNNVLTICMLYLRLKFCTPQLTWTSNILQASASPEEFMQQLPQYDADLTRKRQEAENAGEVSICKLVQVYLLFKEFFMQSLPLFLEILLQSSLSQCLSYQNDQCNNFGLNPTCSSTSVARLISRDNLLDLPTFGCQGTLQGINSQVGDLHELNP